MRLPCFFDVGSLRLVDLRVWIKIIRNPTSKRSRSDAECGAWHMEMSLSVCMVAFHVEVARPTSEVTGCFNLRRIGTM